MSRLILFCGVPGSGKTTIAASLAAKLPQSAHIQTDKVRAMVRPQQYSARESRFVYSAVIVMGRQALIAGYDAILDGTFPREGFRKEALDKLAHLSSAHLVVHTVCDIDLALKRNAARAEVVPKDRLLRIKRRFEVPENAVVIDTGRVSLEEATSMLLAKLKRRDSWP